MTDNATPTTPTEKPLTQSQCRNLTKIIVNDYGQAERDLRMAYDDALREGRRRINEERELQAAAVAVIRSEVETMEADFRARAKALQEDIESRGFELSHLSHGGAYATHTTVTLAKAYEPAGYTERLRKLESELEAKFKHALHDLITARAGAEREVLLATITPGIAQNLLARIPKADELFKDSVAELPEGLTDEQRGALDMAAYNARQSRGRR